MEQHMFKQGEVIFRQGDAGDMAYLVVSGAVEVSRSPDGKKSVLGAIAAGQIFGEMALISDQPRTATATATEDTVCFLVPTKVFAGEMANSSALMRSMLGTFMGHIRNMNVQVEEEKAKASEAELRATAAEQELRLMKGGVEFFRPDDAGNYAKVPAAA